MAVLPYIPVPVATMMSVVSAQIMLMNQKRFRKNIVDWAEIDALPPKTADPMTGMRNVRILSPPSKW